MAPLKSFSELAFKKDKNLPNLKVPVKGKKGVSKYMRKAGITSKKPYDSEFRQRMVASVQSADRKPEKYVKPDGKVGIRMVKTDKEVIKKEAVEYPHMMYDPKTGNEVKAKTPADHNKYAKMGYTHEKPKVDEASMAMKKAEKLMGPSKNYQQAVDRVMKGMKISKPQAEKMVKKILGVNPKTNRIESVNEIVDPMDLRGRPKKRDPYPKSPYGMKHPLHPLNIQKRKEKEKQKKAAAKKEEVEEAKTFKYFDNRDDAHAHAKKHGGKVFVNTGKGATKVKGKPINTHVVIKKEEVDVDEALTMQQRIKKRRDMKRNKARIAIGRRRAKKKMANMKVIKKRSDRQARNAIAKKLTRGIPKRDLTPARKKEIEKRLESPALKMRIKRLSKRMFKDVRKKEVMRKKG